MTEFGQDFIEELIVEIFTTTKCCKRKIEQAHLSRGCFMLVKAPTTDEVRESLVDAHSFFKQECNNFPFNLNLLEEKLDIRKVSQIIIEMTILFFQGIKPKSERIEPSHFGQCEHCFQFLLTTIVAFFYYFNGHKDFRMSYMHSLDMSNRASDLAQGAIGLPCTSDVQEKILHKIIAEKQGEFIPYREIVESTQISVSPLYVAQLVNGQPDYISKAGDRLTYKVEYKNTTGVGINDVVLSVKLDGSAYNINTLDLME